MHSIFLEAITVQDSMQHHMSPNTPNKASLRCKFTFWAARYSTWLLINLTRKAERRSLFFSCKFIYWFGLQASLTDYIYTGKSDVSLKIFDVSEFQST